VIRSAGALSC